MLTSLTLLSLDSVKASFTLFSLNRKVKSALIGTQAARALVLLEKEGVHLIHGQSATGYDTLLHLGEVGLVEQTSVLHVIHHERLQLGLDGLCTGRQPTPRRPDRPRDRPLGIPKGDACYQRDARRHRSLA